MQKLIFILKLVLIVGTHKVMFCLKD